MRNLTRFALVALVLSLMIGFTAVPTFAGEIEEVKEIKVIKADRAFLGVYPKDLEDDDREALDWEKDYGILINDVVSDGPAAEAGLKGGDILIKINGDEIKSLKSLHKVLSQYKPDDKVKAYVIRKGKKKDFKMVLGAMPHKDVNIMNIKKKFSKGGFLGVYSMELTDGLKEYFKVDHGVMLKSVSEDTPAEKAGLKAGDVIMAVDDDKIETSGQLMKALRSCKPETEVAISASREGKPMTVKVVLGSAPIPFDFHTIFGNVDDIDVEEIIQDAMQSIEIQIDAHGDFKEEMDELREDLKELKKELKEIQKNSK